MIQALEEIRGRHAVISEYPWKKHDFGYPGQEEPSSIVIHQGKFTWQAISEGDFIASFPGADRDEDNNADFLANAPVDVEKLLAALDAVIHLAENTDDTVVTAADGPHIPAHLVLSAIASALGGDS